MNQPFSRYDLNNKYYQYSQHLFQSYPLLQVGIE